MKVITVFVISLIVVAVTSAINSPTMEINATFTLARTKRAACNTNRWMCLQHMCNRCCNPGCRGAGCLQGMCNWCCR